VRGDGYIYKRGSRWWIRYSKDGIDYREPCGKDVTTKQSAKDALKVVHRAIAQGAYLTPPERRVTVDELLAGLLVHLRLQGRAYAGKLESQTKPVRTFFGLTRALDVTTQALERYQQERLAADWKPATVNRSLEGLRRAYTYAAKQTPPQFPKHLIPTFPMLPVDNVRRGFFERAEIDALLSNVADSDIRDFIEWGFRTGMRKREISRLTWDMLDRSSTPWVLRVPGAVTKNKQGRSLGLGGSVRAIIERRLVARRLDVPLLFHRTAKGKPGQAIYDIAPAWSAALAAAGLPAGRLFHDLRRSAVRTLIRSGVDPAVAMKVSGHKTRSMLDRYNIVEDQETAAAMAQADAYLEAQPITLNVSTIEGAQKAHNPGVSGKARAV
jgi:integrase